MPHIGVQAVFVVILMFVTTVKTEEGDVTFWNKKVTVKCPAETGIVYGADGKSTDPQGSEHTFEYERQVQYTCKLESGSKSLYHFYIKGRVCQNCFELDAKFFLVIIIVDLFGTAGVMIIIYTCSKKKGSDRSPKPTKTTPKTGSRGPPVPSPDYESLSPHTRSLDTYSAVNSGMVNRTG